MKKRKLWRLDPLTWYHKDTNRKRDVIQIEYYKKKGTVKLHKIFITKVNITDLTRADLIQQIGEKRWCRLHLIAFFLYFALFYWEELSHQWDEKNIRSPFKMHKRLNSFLISKNFINNKFRYSPVHGAYTKATTRLIIALVEIELWKALPL